MEAKGHPDLIHIGRILRERMDRTLEAELQAARAAARRSRGLRDALLALEDGEDRVDLVTSDQSVHRGFITSVGTDNLSIATGSGERLIALAQLVSIEVKPR